MCIARRGYVWRRTDMSPIHRVAYGVDALCPSSAVLPFAQAIANDFLDRHQRENDGRETRWPRGKCEGGRGARYAGKRRSRSWRDQQSVSTGQVFEEVVRAFRRRSTRRSWKARREDPEDFRKEDPEDTHQGSGRALERTIERRLGRAVESRVESKALRRTSPEPQSVVMSADIRPTL